MQLKRMRLIVDGADINNWKLLTPDGSEVTYVTNIVIDGDPSNDKPIVRVELYNVCIIGEELNEQGRNVEAETAR